MMTAPSRFRAFATAPAADRLGATVEDGRVTMFSADETSTSTVFLPVPWWRSGRWLIPALAGAIGLLILTLLPRPIGALIRRVYGVPSPTAAVAAAARRRWLVAVVCSRSQRHSSPPPS